MMQAKSLNDNLVPLDDAMEADLDDLTTLGPIAALRESAATKFCDLKPRWPEALRQQPGSTQFHIYRHKLHDNP